MSAKKSSVYTKGGDTGQTSLLGGKRVPKYDPRIEAYGTIDELMAHTALLRDQVEDVAIREELLKVNGMLMSAAAILASDGSIDPATLPSVNEEDIALLEASIDRMDEELGELKNFLLPGGAVPVSQAHVARTVCRRAERNVLFLSEKEEIAAVIIRFLNRLSDYYFLLSRKLASISGTRQENWKP